MKQNVKLLYVLVFRSDITVHRLDVVVVNIQSGIKCNISTLIMET